MRVCALLLAIVASPPVVTFAQTTGPADATSDGDPSPALPEDYSCNFCHGRDGSLDGDAETQHLVVTEADLTEDIHWQLGLRCHDCHGGNPILEEYVDHRKDTEFRPVVSAVEIPGFCGHCHSNPDYMRRYNPSPRTDQEMEYWTSGHGKHLKELEESLKKEAAEHEPTEQVLPPATTDVATCLDCHTAEGKPHRILAVDDSHSPVYPLYVAETCARCHSDEQKMAGRTYQGRALGHNQYELWKQSVHGVALLKQQDLSAPTCNDCHGNHGALPPEADSVANACGTCHVKVSKLFVETQMKHRFEELELPGCATCHGNHQTLSPSDEMLGMEANTVCVKCHEENQHGATIAGAEAARSMRSSLENLKAQISQAELTLTEAERLGMEVRGPRFDLRQSHDALTNSRSVIHTFSLERVDEVVQEGLAVTSDVQSRAEAALAEHTNRRIWLAVSLLPILAAVGLLLLYIRALGVPSESSSAMNHSAPG